MVSVYAQRPSQLKLGVFFVMDAFVTLVAMSDNGMPQPLQLRLSPSTDVERRREEVWPFIRIMFDWVCPVLRRRACIAHWVLMLVPCFLALFPCGMPFLLQSTGGNLLWPMKTCTDQANEHILLIFFRKRRAGGRRARGSRLPVIVQRRKMPSDFADSPKCRSRTSYAVLLPGTSPRLMVDRKCSRSRSWIVRVGLKAKRHPHSCGSQQAPIFLLPPTRHTRGAMFFQWSFLHSTLIGCPQTFSSHRATTTSSQSNLTALSGTRNYPCCTLFAFGCIQLLMFTETVDSGVSVVRSIERSSHATREDRVRKCLHMTRKRIVPVRWCVEVQSMCRTSFAPLVPSFPLMRPCLPEEVRTSTAATTFRNNVDLSCRGFKCLVTETDTRDRVSPVHFPAGSAYAVDVQGHVCRFDVWRFPSVPSTRTDSGNVVCHASTSRIREHDGPAAATAAGRDCP